MPIVISHGAGTATTMVPTVNGANGKVLGTTGMTAAVAGFIGVARVVLRCAQKWLRLQDVTRIVFPCCMVDWVTQVGAF